MYDPPPFRNNWRHPGVRGTGDRKRTSSGLCRCENLHYGPTSKRRLSCPYWFKFKSTFRASASYGLQMEHCVNVQGLRSGLRTCICIWESRKDPINLHFLISPADARNKKPVHDVYLQFSRTLHTSQKAVTGRKSRRNGATGIVVKQIHIPTARRFIILSCIQANKQANVYFQQPLKLEYIYIYIYIIYLFSRLYDVSTSFCAHLTIILSSSSICLCHSSLLPLIPFPPSVL